MNWFGTNKKKEKARGSKDELFESSHQDNLSQQVISKILKTGVSISPIKVTNLTEMANKIKANIDESFKKNILILESFDLKHAWEYVAKKYDVHLNVYTFQIEIAGIKHIILRNYYDFKDLDHELRRYKFLEKRLLEQGHGGIEQPEETCDLQYETTMLNKLTNYLDRRKNLLTSAEEWSADWAQIFRGFLGIFPQILRDGMDSSKCCKLQKKRVQKRREWFYESGQKYD